MPRPRLRSRFRATICLALLTASPLLSQTTGLQQFLLNSPDPRVELGHALDWRIESSVDGRLCLDVDQDGDSDLLLGSTLLLRLPSSQDAPRYRATSGLRLTNGPRARVGTVAADFDRDGDTDVVTATGTIVHFHRNDGGQFDQPTTIASFPILRDVATADFDGDSIPDLVIAAGQSYRDPQVWVLLGNGGGTFRPRQLSDVPQNPLAVLPLDLDADGDIDLVGAGNLPTMAWRNDGTAVFRRISPSPFAEGGPSPVVDLVAADFDGDGDTDLLEVAGSKNSGNNQGARIPRLLFQDQQGFFAPRTAPTGVEISSPHRCGATGDLNGDGLLDIVLEAEHERFRVPLGDAPPHVLLGDGTGRFHPAPDSFLPDSPYALPTATLADVNGDGIADCVGAAAGLLLGDRHQLRDALPFRGRAHVPLPARIRSLDPEGAVPTTWFTPERDLHRFEFRSGDLERSDPPADAYSLAAFGDVDGDGDLDAIGFSTAFSAEVWLQQDGRLRLAPGRVQASPRVLWLGTLADFDGDGDLDCIYQDLGTSGLEGRVLEGDGRGNFAPHPRSPPQLSSDSNWGHWVDLDGDGAVDLMAAVRQNPAAWEVYWNDGQGNFGTPTRAPFTGWIDYVADFDGDGSIECAATISDNRRQRIDIWRFRRDRSFELVQSVDASPPGSTTSLFLGTGDFDQDGRTDWISSWDDPSRLPNQDRIVGVRSGRDYGTWLVQQPIGNDPNDPWFLPSAAGAADFDQDGDLDLLLTNNDPDSRTVSRVLFGATRHTEILGPPALGGAFRIRCTARAPLGAAGAADVLALPLLTVDRDLLTRPRLLPGRGALWLDSKALLVPLEGKRIPLTAGQSDWTYRIPNDPALLGGGLAIQAVFAPSDMPSRWHLGPLAVERIVP